MNTWLKNMTCRCCFCCQRCGWDRCFWRGSRSCRFEICHRTKHNEYLKYIISKFVICPCACKKKSPIPWWLRRNSWCQQFTFRSCLHWQCSVWHCCICEGRWHCRFQICSQGKVMNGNFKEIFSNGQPSRIFEINFLKGWNFSLHWPEKGKSPIPRVLRQNTWCQQFTFRSCLHWQCSRWHCCISEGGWLCRFQICSQYKVMNENFEEISSNGQISEKARKRGAPYQISAGSLLLNVFLMK